MKILFIVTVIIASSYLFIQQDGLEKLNQYLPQYKIEQSAAALLTTVDESVDQKLERFKTELLNKKDHRINELEKQLVSLQAKFTAKTEQENTQRMLVEQNIAQTQYINNDSLPISGYEKKEASEEAVIANSSKQKAIKRQANLQDIADRMNKTSLLALTQ
jgi:hypothetical protein